MYIAVPVLAALLRLAVRTQRGVPGERTALAVAAVTRPPGLAIVIATTTRPRAELVPAVIVIVVFQQSLHFHRPNGEDIRCTRASERRATPMFLPDNAPPAGLTILVLKTSITRV